MEKEKFAYQFVFSFGDDDKVIIEGTTTSSLVAMLSSIQSKVNSVFGTGYVLTSSQFANLQKLVKNGTEKKTQK